MKITVLALAVWALAYPGRAAEEPGYFLEDIREIFVKSGFLGNRADHFDLSFDPTGRRYVTAALLGNARLQSKRLSFRADRILFIYYPKEQHLGLAHPFEIYAEGNVVLSPGPEYPLGPKVFVMADALYYDGRTLQGLAANVTARAADITTLELPDVPQSLAFIAQELRFRGKVDSLKDKAGRTGVSFNYFAGKEITVTTCDLALPHWGLQCGELEAWEEEAEQDYTIAASGVYAAVVGRRILPLFPATLSTSYFNSIPLRRLQVVTSRKFGYGLRSTWSVNRMPLLGQALRTFTRRTGVPIELDAKLDPLSKRGVGLGGEARYGIKPSRWQEGSWRNFKGDIRFFWIRDQGHDRNERTLFPGHSPGEWRADDRFRLRGFHRMTLPVIGSIDGEIAYWRDRNFYKEFFEDELYSERRPENPETYLLWRRRIGADGLLSVLARPRVNDFKNDFKEYTERLPEGVAELFPRRLTYDFGPTVEAQARAAYLRKRPDEFYEETRDSFATGRYHGEGTVALPLGIGRYIRFRPAYSARGTVYDERWQLRGGAERLVQDAGVTAATHIWRNFALDSTFLNTQAVRHVIVPQVSYFNAFFSDHDKDEFFRFDAIDALDRFEYLEFAVATYLLGHAKRLSPGAEGAIRGLIELRSRVRYFPVPGRDNLRGGKPQNWSDVYLDAFADILSPYFGFGVESRLDTSRGKGFAALDPYISLALPGRFQLTAGELFIAEDELAGVQKSDFFWATLYWLLSDLYTIEANFRYDFARRRTVQQYYGISRRFHCITVGAGVEIDEGDDETEFRVDVYPTGFQRRKR